MRYEINDKPKALHMFLYGVQWFTAILPSLIIITGVVSGLHTEDPTLKTVFTQKVFLLTGLAMIVQVMYGHRLPLLIGPATILLIGITSTLNLSLEASFTAMGIGGFLIIILTFGKLFDYIQKLFTTRVIVVTLMLVAITICPLIVSLSVGTNGEVFINILFVIVLTLFMMIGNTIAKGIWKSLVILAGMVLGTFLYISIFGSSVEQSVQSYSWTVFTENLIIKPEFNISAILAFIFCFLAVTVNEVGAVQATAQFIKADKITDRSKKGVRVTGFFNGIAGMLGVIGLVDYSMSPGIISATRSASRYPLIVTGVIILVCAFIPHSLFVFSYIPTVVMGSVLLYVMCTQLGSGLQMMTSVPQTVAGFNEAITIAFPIMIGILISFAPQSFHDSIPSLLKPILGNGFIMGIVSVLLLEHILNRKSN